MGIVATVITSGTIDTNNVTIYGSEGYKGMEITGDKIKIWDSRDTEVYTEMKRGSFHSNKGAFSLTGFDGIKRGSNTVNIQTFNNIDLMD